MKKAIFIIIVILIGISIINLSLAPTAKKIIIDLAKKEFKSDVQIKGLSINLLTGTVTASGIIVKDLSGAKQMEIQKLSSSGSYLPLLKKQLYVRSVVVDSLTLWVRREKTGQVSVEQARKDTQASLKKLNSIVKKAVVKNGTVKIILEGNPAETALDIVHINGQAENIVFSPDEKDYWAVFSANGIVNGQRRAKIAVSGRYNTISENYNFEVNFTLKDASIPDFKDFYKGRFPFEIAKGDIVLEGKMKCKDNILDSDFKAQITGLQLKQESIPQTLFNLPSQTMVAFLKDSGGNINYEFKISGDITNPKFSLTSNLNQSVVGVFLNTLKSGVNTFSSAIGTVTQTGTKAITDTIKGIGNAIPGANH